MKNHIFEISDLEFWKSKIPIYFRSRLPKTVLRSFGSWGGPQSLLFDFRVHDLSFAWQQKIMNCLFPIVSCWTETVDTKLREATQSYSLCFPKLFCAVLVLLGVHRVHFSTLDSVDCLTMENNELSSNFWCSERSYTNSDRKLHKTVLQTVLVSPKPF